MTLFEIIYKKNPGMLSREIGGEVVLLPINQNIGNLDNIYALNEVGAFIYGNINEKNSLSEILQMIIEEFDVNVETAKNELNNFIQCLKEINAISLACE